MTIKRRVIEVTTEAGGRKGFVIERAHSIESARAEAVARYEKRLGMTFETDSLTIDELTPDHRRYDEYVSSLKAREASDEAAAEMKEIADAKAAAEASGN